MNNHVEAPEHLTLKQAAELLNCTDRHLRALIAENHLPAFRVAGGRMIRVKRADVLALLKPIPTLGAN